MDTKANFRIIGTLVSLAFVSIIVYLFALFRVEPVRAHVFSVATSTDVSLSVSSTTDLDVYTRSITEKNADVTNVVVREDAVAVSHKAPARFFGLFPMTVLVTAQADESGNVIIKRPWYASLQGKNVSEVKPGLRLHVGQILKNATTTSPQAQAEIIQALHTALKEIHM